MATPRTTWMTTFENAQKRLKNSSRRNSKFGIVELALDDVGVVVEADDVRRRPCR